MLLISARGGSPGSKQTAAAGFLFSYLTRYKISYPSRQTTTPEKNREPLF
jgi:hypothetical protein